MKAGTQEDLKRIRAKLGRKLTRVGNNFSCRNPINPREPSWSPASTVQVCAEYVPDGDCMGYGISVDASFRIGMSIADAARAATLLTESVALANWAQKVIGDWEWTVEDWREVS